MVYSPETPIATAICSRAKAVGFESPCRLSRVYPVFPPAMVKFFGELRLFRFLLPERQNALVHQLSALHTSSPCRRR
jgi:hypothetical protein